MNGRRMKRSEEKERAMVPTLLVVIIDSTPCSRRTG